MPDPLLLSTQAAPPLPGASTTPTAPNTPAATDTPSAGARFADQMAVALQTPVPGAPPAGAPPVPAQVFAPAPDPAAAVPNAAAIQADKPAVAQPGTLPEEEEGAPATKDGDPPPAMAAQVVEITLLATDPHPLPVGAAPQTPPPPDAARPGETGTGTGAITDALGPDTGVRGGADEAAGPPAPRGAAGRTRAADTGPEPLSTVRAGPVGEAALQPPATAEEGDEPAAPTARFHAALGPAAAGPEPVAPGHTMVPADLPALPPPGSAATLATMPRPAEPPRAEPPRAEPPEAEPPRTGAPGPVAQLGAAFVSLPAARAGAAQTLVIRLDPLELGRVQIRVERGGDGPAQVSLAVERTDTLLLLMQDRPRLDQVLTQAGVPPEGRTLTFSLGDPQLGGGAAGGAGDGHAGRGHGQPEHGGQRHAGAAPSNGAPWAGAAWDGAPSGAAVQARAWRRAGIDITA